MGDDSAFEVAAAPVLTVLAATEDRPGLLIDFARSVLRRVPPARLVSGDAARTASAVTAVFSFVDGRQRRACLMQSGHRVVGGRVGR